MRISSICVAFALVGGCGGGGSGGEGAGARELPPDEPYDDGAGGDEGMGEEGVGDEGGGGAQNRVPPSGPVHVTVVVHVGSDEATVPITLVDADGNTVAEGRSGQSFDVRPGSYTATARIRERAPHHRQARARGRGRDPRRRRLHPRHPRSGRAHPPRRPPQRPHPAEPSDHPLPAGRRRRSSELPRGQRPHPHQPRPLRSRRRHRPRAHPCPRPHLHGRRHPEHPRRHSLGEGGQARRTVLGSTPDARRNSRVAGFLVSTKSRGVPVASMTPS